jgi:hypothetical protein
MASRSSGFGEIRFSPFVVAIDTREQHPFTFDGLKDGPPNKLHPLIVKTEGRTLQSGDYSIVGLEDRISVERKSLEDLYGTLTHGRERFERELERLQRMTFSAVVVEASWITVCRRPPERSQVIPKTIYRSILAFSQRYLKTHWYLCDSRRFAEVTTYRILERFWTDHVIKPAAEQRRLQRISTSDGLGFHGKENGSRK